MCAMYEHGVTLDAPPETIIWKYFERKYFDSLINEEALFFRRVLDFAVADDPFEGTLPCKDRKRDRLAALRSPHLDIASFRQRVEMAENADAFAMRAATVINSWTINDYEVDHMWRIYARADRDIHGVAIRSTVGKLHEALENADEQVCGTRVRYIDYRQETFFKAGEYEHGTENALVPLIHKHIQGYRDEREYRLLHQHSGGSFKPEELWTKYGLCRGHKIQVLLPVMVCEVVMSPFATSEQKDEVESLCRGKVIWAPVRYSNRSQLVDCE